jgi:hypothetical protein
MSDFTIKDSRVALSQQELDALAALVKADCAAAPA